MVAHAGGAAPPAASLARLALLHLASPVLPVGAYSYSQGLESAIDLGWVSTADAAGRWIGDALTFVVGAYEAPVWLRLHAAASKADWATLLAWNAEFIATRESAELRAETVQMGYSLLELLRALGHGAPFHGEEISYPAAQAWACTLWQVPADDGLLAYLFSWAENQVMAALKAVPLGQVAGQKMLLALRPRIAAVALSAATLSDDDLNTQAPLFAIASARHETQYSRLFRS